MFVEKTSTSIMDMDFEFENTAVRIVASRESPQIELSGLKIGPFTEGSEYEVRFWVAQELEKAGIARLRDEELLNAVGLYKIQWKERVQTSKHFSSLPDDFYPKLRRYLIDTKEEAVRKPEKIREYEKIVSLSHDIINCRLKKIVSLSSSTAQTSQILKELTPEERVIYDDLHQIINDWRLKILNEGIVLD